MFILTLGCVPFRTLETGIMCQHTFVFYLQLRSSLQAHGAPVRQALPIHPLHKWLVTRSISNHSSDYTCLLLIDLSVINITKLKKRIVLVGLTAAKKLVSMRWKPPHSLSIRQWVFTFLDVIYLEMSTARVNGASEATINIWRETADSLKELIRWAFPLPDQTIILLFFLTFLQMSLDL